MMATEKELILFDLDNTLFDHQYSLRCALAAVREAISVFKSWQTSHLVEQYNAALQVAYDKYLNRQRTLRDTDEMKVKLFYHNLGIQEPSARMISSFREIYKKAYRENRRATPTSIETLTKLRDHGHRLAIVTNGQIDDQRAKAISIGVEQLVDCIITSEEVEHAKPDKEIFEFALEKLSSVPEMTFMIGDSLNADINGALNVGVKAVLYSPTAQVSHITSLGQLVPVIHQMNQLLEILGIPT